jgi:hypothetical protein
VGAGALAVRAGVVHAHHDGVGLLVRARRATVVAYVAHDQPTVAEAELRAVVLADPDALDEAERRLQPLDGLAHVRVHEHRDHRGRRDRAVALHAVVA